MAVEMNYQSETGTDVPNYIDKNISMKVVKLIQSYTGIINRKVWGKY